jgi:cellobiose-specific phosphotransferase system component IIA
MPKEDRIAKRDAKLNEQLKSEASKYGIDLNTQYTTPDISKSKADITLPVMSANPTQAVDINNFAAGYVNPNLTGQTSIDQEALKRQLKKQKIAKIGDVLTALGTGLQGKQVDPSKFASSQMQADREKQYLNYRNIAEANKNAAAIWSDKYRSDLLDFVNKKLSSDKTSEADKAQLELIKAKVEGEKANTSKTKTEEQWLKNKPYYNPNTGNSQSKTPRPSYQIQTKTKDGQSQTLNIPLPEDPAMAMKLNNDILNLNQLKANRKEIQDQMDAAVMDAEGSGIKDWVGFGSGETQKEATTRIQQQYQSELDKLDTDITTAENQLQNSFQPESSESPQKPSTTKKTLIQESAEEIKAKQAK